METQGTITLGQTDQDLVVTQIKCEATDRVTILGKNILILPGATRCVNLEILAEESAVFLATWLVKGKATAITPRRHALIENRMVDPNSGVYTIDGDLTIAAGQHALVGRVDNDRLFNAMRDLPVAFRTVLFDYRFFG